MDDSADADVWRLSAEQQYTTSLHLEKQKNDTNGLEILQDLRGEWEQLNEFRREDLLVYFVFDNDNDNDGDDNDQLTLLDSDSSYMDTETAEEAMEGLGENDEAGVDLEDAVAVIEIEVENANEVVFNTISLPIRPASSDSV